MKRLNILEFLNAVHPLRFLRRKHEAAERGLEILSARAVGHAAQARAVPVDLARLRVEGAFLVGLGLETF